MEFSKYRWEVCGKCDGEGRVAHPAFSDGFTQQEWYDWEPEERERYMTGFYDVTCPDCSGRTTVKVPDVSRMTFAEKRQLVIQQRDAQLDREIEREYAMERAMGA